MKFQPKQQKSFLFTGRLYCCTLLIAERSLIKTIGFMRLMNIGIFFSQNLLSLLEMRVTLIVNLLTVMTPDYNESQLATKYFLIVNQN